jgi:DNA-binding CsgD family transcriptional regulator
MSPQPLPRIPLPLVGRVSEFGEVRELLSRAEESHGGAVLLHGGTGVGKSRLLDVAVEQAAGRGWYTVRGRSYPVEAGIPYAPFADGFVPFLRSLGPDLVSLLTRGGEGDLGHLFPSIRGEDWNPGRFGDPAELKSRLLWNFTQFVTRASARQPLLLVLDDLQWGDASSLELLHFLARQISGDRVAVLGAYNDTLSGDNPRLRATEQSLVSIGAAVSVAIDPLDEAATASLVRAAFGVQGVGVVESFASALFRWTRGNPFFLEETLKALVESGRLRREDGEWVGWAVEDLTLPASVREAVLQRVGALSLRTRSLAELIAAIGTNVTFDTLLAISGLDPEAFVESIADLRRHRLIEERSESGSIAYDFGHPMVREVVYTEIGLTRARLLHGRIGLALEEQLGEGATGRAGELAYHFTRAGSWELMPRAIGYLAAAGRAALRTHSNREAADYLQTALDRISERAESPDPALVEDLARARQRLGDFDGAGQLWREILASRERSGDEAGVANAWRRLGVVEYWRGAYGEALDHLERALSGADRAGDATLAARIHLARGECFMEVGRADRAGEEIRLALTLAESGGSPAVMARAHLASLLLHTWLGPPEKARHHGAQALEHAERLGDRSLLCTVHWGMAVHAGLTSDVPAFTLHTAESGRVAEEIGSPLHRIRVAEPVIEYLSNTGEWQRALELAEPTIAAARALNQRSSLARLLVWTSLILLGRGDVRRGEAYAREAWELSGAGREGGTGDVHVVVPAHVGLAAYHMTVGEFDRAVALGHAGLEIADRSGYAVWSIHRLLPLLAEAYVWKGDLEGAALVGRRLRAASERIGHTLGLAWADACDAVLVWLGGDVRGAIDRLGAAAERLDQVPAVPDAARLRRHLAARLRDAGERETALRLLRDVHDVFVRLGAERELAKTREQMRELGARPPVRDPGRGIEGLSTREIEIATLVSQGRSNKAIAKILDISPRTVSTHLSNIFGKLGVASRLELTDQLRETGLAG